MTFSIIVVSLNAGDKLKSTINSILAQKCEDYEIVLKDGLSTDNSLEDIKALKDERIHIFSEKDKGIYDAMNQGIIHATGDYVYFLNCGDYFNSDMVLSHVYGVINSKDSQNYDIIYGNIFQRTTGEQIMSNPNINAFACYRNVPCHQTSFFKREVIVEHPFDTAYKIRADYEQFLWCFFEKKATLKYVDMIVADYEGDGFSETRENLKVSKKEHKSITRKYMTKSQLFKFRLIMILTLSPLRSAIANSPATAKFYNKIKRAVYKGKDKQ